MMKKTGCFFVYILRCKDSTLYTGYTNDLEKRIALHNSGRGAKYVRGKGPVTLVYRKKYCYLKSVLRAERTIKLLKKKDKEKLIGIYERKK